MQNLTYNSMNGCFPHPILILGILAVLLYCVTYAQASSLVTVNIIQPTDGDLIKVEASMDENNDFIYTSTQEVKIVCVLDRGKLSDLSYVKIRYKREYDENWTVDTYISPAERMEMVWTPKGKGKYLICAQAVDTNGDADDDPSSIMVKVHPKKSKIEEIRERIIAKLRAMGRGIKQAIKWARK